MARVFITFVGAGAYSPVRYARPGGSPSAPTRFAQRAVLEALGVSSFDRVVVFATRTSHKKNWPGLEAELAELGVGDRASLRWIPESLDETSQWSWFETLLDAVEPYDSLVFDTTHGFRAVPLVMCAAVGYLRRAKRARIEGIFYGAEPPTGSPEGTPGLLVDMSGFFVIHDWAEGVARLVESADAGKLAALAAEAATGSFAGLRDPELVQALEHLTRVLKNVEVHRVEEAARDALARLRVQHGAGRTGAERHLVQLVIDEVTTLTVSEPTEGRYTRAYLTLQLRVAELLLEHGLLMQAFTVLRELVGSIGMLGVPEKHRARAMSSSEGRSLRGRYAETFLAMAQFPRHRWRFSEERMGYVEALLPWFERVMEASPTLVDDVREIVDLRNGFDHGWTSKAGPPPDVAARARALCARLGAATGALPEP